MPSPPDPGPDQGKPLRMGRRGMAGVVALLILLCGSYNDPAAAPRKKGKKPWKIYTQLELVYDDNVINYSDFDLDLFDTGGRPEKFAIESKSDFVTRPRLDFELKHGSLPGLSATSRLTLRYSLYAKNSLKNYFTATLRSTQRHPDWGYAEFRISYYPKYYYRNQWDDIDGSYKEAYFWKLSTRLEVGREVSKALKAAGGYNYYIKDFDDPFSERDSKTHRLFGRFVYRESRLLKFWGDGDVSYSRAEGRNSDDPTIKDTSYDAWGLGLGARVYLRYLGIARTELVGSVGLDRIMYQTERTLDVYRLGRRDTNLRLRLGMAHSLANGVRIEADYNRYGKSTDLADDSLRDRLEYDSNELSITLKYNL